MTCCPDFKMLAEQLVQTARWSSRMGWAPATSTNYSVRLPVLSGWELLKGLNGIDTHEVQLLLPVFPNSQNMQSLSTRLEQSLSREQSCYGFLLAGHGLYAWGKDLPEAKRHLEVLEYLLQCQREVTLHGHSTNTR
jgi:ribulose-5-phosphate 4-epimerase/fuculose-1-phosphate aldolase